MKSVLVTGATGFIGSRLVSALVEKNIQCPLL
ncbi:MAG: NAD-dependent epimerase/dehydratase family protein [Nitrosopumilus sp.]|nr:NAD-dependent epimerase/dehydratase family protein [Nitrosopumilus sp.]